MIQAPGGRPGAGFPQYRMARQAGLRAREQQVANTCRADCLPAQKRSGLMISLSSPTVAGAAPVFNRLPVSPLH